MITIPHYTGENPPPGVNNDALDPELKVLAGHLGKCDRLFLAKKLARWARQLRRSVDGRYSFGNLRKQPPNVLQRN